MKISFYDFYEREPRRHKSISSFTLVYDSLLGKSDTPNQVVAHFGPMGVIQANLCTLKSLKNDSVEALWSHSIYRYYYRRNHNTPRGEKIALKKAFRIALLGGASVDREG